MIVKKIVFIALLGGLLLTAACTLLPGSGVRGGVLLQENFRRGETGFWYTEADGIGQTLIADEVLLIEIYQPQTVQYSALQEPLFADFKMDVEVTQLAGSLNSTYGVLWRMQNDSAFYRFSITGNGLFVVEKKLAEGDWERLMDDWQETPAIIQGLNQTNILGVEAAGSNMKFFINDELVAELSDASYAAGRIALSAGTFNQGGLRVAFDNVILRRP